MPIVHTIDGVEFHWSAEKSRLNLAKHGIPFADAVSVFFDPDARYDEDRDALEERRFLATGHDGLGRRLVVVWSDGPGERIRIISARRASPAE